MANQQHVDLLKLNISHRYGWDEWRRGYPEIQPDLSGIDFSNTDLSYFNLSRAYLSGARLHGAKLNNVNLNSADLSGTDFSMAVLKGANLRNANLYNANLSDADCSHANLHGTNLSHADLRRAKFFNADLIKASLVNTNLEGALLKDCFIHGISVWNVQLQGAKQENLIITHEHEPIITVDNLKIAQFIYLLLNNEEIRDFLNTITSKAVLILGRFTSDRKAVLDALREALRKRDYIPVLFDFNRPGSRDVTETVRTLAHLSRFIIADLTDPKSIPQELAFIVPSLPSVPIQPLILSSQREYGMFEHFRRFPWVLPVYRYKDEVSLLQALQEEVIVRAEQKAEELTKR